MVLKSVGVLSVAKVCAALYAALGLIAGCIFALISLLGAGLGAGSQGEAAFGAIFGIGAVIFLPILYGIMGFLFGGLSAWLYNVFATMVGGVRLELEPVTALR